MNLIEIKKPTHDQERKINTGKENFDKMMETIKPFLKEKSVIHHNSDIDWSHCEA